MNPTLPDPFTSHRTQPQQPPPTNMQQFRPPPFPLQQQQSRQGSGMMNELDSLGVRCIELETELRLTKDQVVQAQSGTQYLVNCFAGQQNRGLVQGYGQDQIELQSQYQQLQTEVHRLKGQLLVQQKSRMATPKVLEGEDVGLRARADMAIDALGKKLNGEIEVLKEQRASLLNDVLHLLKEDPNDYSFRFDDEDPAIYKPLEHFKHKLAAPKSSQTSLVDGDLLGESQGLASPFDEKKMGKVYRVDSPLSSSTPMVKKPRIYIKPGDIALLDLGQSEQEKYERHVAREAAQADVPRPSVRDSRINQADSRLVDQPDLHRPVGQRPPIPSYDRRDRRRYDGPQYFAPFEHNHLMGNAIFVEEKDPDEYLEFFEDLEADHKRFAGRHTKEEWKMYYERNVRPTFLRRMAEREPPIVPGEREVKAEKENVAPAGEAPVIAEAGEVADVIEIAKHVVSDAKAEAEVEAVVPVVGPKKEPETKQSTTAKAAGLEASQWAAPEDKTSLVSAAPQIERDVKFEFKATAGAPLSPKSKPVDKEEAIIMPSVPAFGGFDLLPPPRPASNITQAPIPGLAGGWPKPPPHLRGRPLGRAAAPIAEKDPGTWNYLFPGLKGTSENRFVLGHDEKFCRTVTISGIPVGTTLAEVLDQVRGGKVVSAKFFDTAELKTQPRFTTNTVIVEFLGSQRAKSFVDHCEQEPLSFEANAEGEQNDFDVRLVRTQTFPLPPVLLADMLKPEGAVTRVLFLIFIDAANAPMPEVLAQEITSFAIKNNYNDLPKLPLRITVAEDEMLLFEYASARQAAAAWNVVCALDWKLGEVSKGFAADPCAQAFECSEQKDELEEYGKDDAEEKGETMEGLKEVVDELEAEAKARWSEG